MTSNLTEKGKADYHTIGDKWGFSTNTHHVSSFGEHPLVNSSPPAGAYFNRQVRILLNPEN